MAQEVETDENINYWWCLRKKTTQALISPSVKKIYIAGIHERNA